MLVFIPIHFTATKLPMAEKHQSLDCDWTIYGIKL